MTVRGHVNAENHDRKVDMHSRVMAACEPATLLMQVHTKTVEWDPKFLDMESIKRMRRVM